MSFSSRPLRVAPVSIVLVVVALTSCAASERKAVETYFDEAQLIAERMVVASSNFEKLMSEQENPLEWSADEKASIAKTIETLQGLHDEAEEMSVPEAFAAVHPLLVDSMSETIAAVHIIRDIAADPTAATDEASGEMIAKAENAERLARDYVQQAEEVLRTNYPEMLPSEDGAMVEDGAMEDAQ